MAAAGPAVLKPSCRLALRQLAVSGTIASPGARELEVPAGGPNDRCAQKRVRVRDVHCTVAALLLARLPRHESNKAASRSWKDLPRCSIGPSRWMLVCDLAALVIYTCTRKCSRSAVGVYPCTRYRITFTFYTIESYICIHYTCTMYMCEDEETPSLSLPFVYHAPIARPRHSIITGRASFYEVNYTAENFLRRSGMEPLSNIWLWYVMMAFMERAMSVPCNNNGVGGRLVMSDDSCNRTSTRARTRRVHSSFRNLIVSAFEPRARTASMRMRKQSIAVRIGAPFGPRLPSLRLSLIHI